MKGSELEDYVIRLKNAGLDGIEGYYTDYDDSMESEYQALAKKHGGQLIGQYRNAIFLIIDDEHTYSSMDPSIATEPFILSSVPHKKRVKGFPLDCLSKDIVSGKYYYDMEDPTLTSDTEEGLREFFRGVLGK
jgi:8-oxo-dGTP diphosphatase